MVASLLAAAVHDYEHPGFKKFFLFLGAPADFPLIFHQNFRNIFWVAGLLVRVNNITSSVAKANAESLLKGGGVSSANILSMPKPAEEQTLSIVLWAT